MRFHGHVRGNGLNLGYKRLESVWSSACPGFIHIHNLERERFVPRPGGEPNSIRTRLLCDGRSTETLQLSLLLWVLVPGL